MAGLQMATPLFAPELIAHRSCTSAGLNVRSHIGCYGDVIVIMVLIVSVIKLPVALADSPNNAVRKELTQWIMTYYSNPDPDQLVARVNQMVKGKMLSGSNRKGYEM